MRDRLVDLVAEAAELDELQREAERAERARVESWVRFVPRHELDILIAELEARVAAGVTRVTVHEGGRDRLSGIVRRALLRRALGMRHRIGAPEFDTWFVASCAFYAPVMPRGLGRFGSFYRCRCGEVAVHAGGEFDDVRALAERVHRVYLRAVERRDVASELRWQERVAASRAELEAKRAREAAEVYVPPQPAEPLSASLPASPAEPIPATSTRPVRVRMSARRSLLERVF